MSVNRASEVWKEIKPFAIRDMNRMLDNKAGDSGDDLYAIILYDESAQKIKYYSMSREGLDAALLSASSGDIIVIPAGEIGESEASVIPSLASNTKALDLGTGNSGNDPPAGWNEVVFDDSEWETPTTRTANFVKVQDADVLWSSRLTTNSRAAFRHVFFITDFDEVELIWDGDDRTNGVYVNGTLVDDWLSAVGGNDHAARTIDITGLLNGHGNNVICIDQYDVYGSEEPGGAVSWVISINPSSKISIPSGVEIVGIGKNSIFNTNVENNGILTNIQVTGEITGSGLCRMVPNPTAEVFGNQIKSLVETGSSPFLIASTTLNDNLNADLLDGEHASAFADANHTHIEDDITDLDHDAAKIDGITVDLTGITDGQTIKYDLANTKLIAGDDEGGGALADLTDVDLTGLADGDVLVYDETSGDWLPDTPAAGITVEEIDGTPSVSGVNKINVTNGTLTDDGSGEITLDFGSAATDGSAIHDNEANEISAITEKETPADDDLLIIEDSEASYVKKKLKIGNLPGGVGAKPYYVEVNVWLPKTLSGSWTISSDSALIYGGRHYSGAQNDYIEWDVLLASGTWKISIMGQKGATRGIITASIDGSDVGTIDFYNSSVTSNKIEEITGITIASSGVKTFRLRCDTKNASASNYLMFLQMVVLIRTGD